MKNSSYFYGDRKCRFKEFDKGGYPIYDQNRPDEHGGFKQKECSISAYCFDYEKLQELYHIDFERKFEEETTESEQSIDFS